MKPDDGKTHYTTTPTSQEEYLKLKRESPDGYMDETGAFHYNDKQTERRHELSDEDRAEGRNYRTSKTPSARELEMRRGDFRDKAFWTTDKLLKYRMDYQDDEQLQDAIDNEFRNRGLYQYLRDKATGNNGAVNKDAPATKANDYEGVAKDIDDYKNIVDKIEDYYKDSIGSGLDDLSSRDKKILALEHIGTTMKNLAKMQPYIGSIYGRQHEEVGPGDEKSMLQNVVETNLKGGLERRNKRMSAALDQQIKMSNFPSDLKMKMSEIANANNLDFAQKKRLIDVEIQKYAKQVGIDINAYNKRADTDVEKQQKMLENEANRPYRFGGNITTPVGGVSVQ